MFILRKVFTYEIKKENRLDEYYFFNTTFNQFEYEFEQFRHNRNSDLSFIITDVFYNQKMPDKYTEQIMFFYKKENLYKNGKLKRCLHYFMTPEGEWKLTAIEKIDKDQQNIHFEIIETSPLKTTLNFSSNNLYSDLYDLPAFKKNIMLFLLPVGNITLNYSENILNSISEDEYGTPILSLDKEGITISNKRYNFNFETYSPPEKIWE